MRPTHMRNMLIRSTCAGLVLLFSDAASANTPKTCPDRPGYSYIIDNGYIYPTEENFTASIWIEPARDVRNWDYGQQWENLEKDIELNRVYETKPYAVCEISNWANVPGRTGGSMMTCKNSLGHQHSQENSLSSMAAGKYYGVPTANGIPFNTFRKVGKLIYHCLTGRADVYAAGYVIRGDISPVKNTFNDDEGFWDKIYYSKTSWKPYKVTLIQDAPTKSQYRF